MSDRKRSKPARTEAPPTPAMIRRKNMALNRRNSLAAASNRLDAVMRKVSRAVRADENITLSPREAEQIEGFYKIATSSQRVGAPQVLAEFHRWMARDVYWWREELDRLAMLAAEKEGARKTKAPLLVTRLRGALKVTKSNRTPKVKATVADSTVAKAWGVSRTSVEQAVRDHGRDAQDWLKKYGGDRESTAVLIAQRAHAFRMLGIERSREEEPTQRARRDAERTSGGRMLSVPARRSTSDTAGRIRRSKGSSEALNR